MEIVLFKVFLTLAVFIFFALLVSVLRLFDIAGVVPEAGCFCAICFCGYLIWIRRWK